MDAQTPWPRFEYKFLASDSILPALHAHIAPFMRPDIHARGTSGYTVRSIYFDSSSFESYFEKESGASVRTKLRVRGYGNGDAYVFLEIKRRIGETGVKHRAPVLWHDLGELFATGQIDRYVMSSRDLPRAAADASRFLFRMHKGSLGPVVLVTYDREAFVGTVEPSLRITCDRNLRSMAFPRLEDLHEEKRLQRLLPGHFILEIKHDSAYGFPRWMRSFIAEKHLFRQAVSKFTMSLDAQSVPQAHARVTALASTYRPSVSVS